jgi:hypothetical protein
MGKVSAYSTVLVSGAMSREPAKTVNSKNFHSESLSLIFRTCTMLDVRQVYVDFL